MLLDAQVELDLLPRRGNMELLIGVFDTARETPFSVGSEKCTARTGNMGGQRSQSCALAHCRLISFFKLPLHTLLQAKAKRTLCIYIYVSVHGPRQKLKSRDRE
jgi:hypothetical protein